VGVGISTSLINAQNHDPKTALTRRPGLGSRSDPHFKRESLEGSELEVGGAGVHGGFSFLSSYDDFELTRT